MYIGLHVNTVIVVRFESNANFLNRFLKNTQISNLVRIRPVGSMLFHADGQTDGQDTDITKLIVAFRNFANLPKNYIFCPYSVSIRSTQFFTININCFLVAVLSGWSFKWKHLYVLVIFTHNVVNFILQKLNHL
jgi:hypothetical protein